MPSEFNSDPIAVNVAITSDQFTVELADGRSLTVPLDWYPRLCHGSETELSNWRLLGNGYAIEWPDLDEHIGIEGLLAGRRGGECDASIKKWLADRGQ
jgi:hypothetical protein